MQFKTVASSALLAGAAAAAGPTNNFTQANLSELLTPNGPHYVDATTRANWCTGQHTACSILCGATANNDCDPTALTWDCTCVSNNSAPGLQWYTTSMPNVLCNTLNGDCMADNANDLIAQQGCNKTFVCENLNITKFSNDGSSASTTTSASNAAATGSSTTSAAASASSTGAAVALAIGEQYGIGILGAGVAAMLALLL